jgi:hypothetical protein
MKTEALIHRSISLGIMAFVVCVYIVATSPGCSTPEWKLEENGKNAAKAELYDKEHGAVKE